MRIQYILGWFVVLGAGALSAFACINDGSQMHIAFGPPRDPRQLPADIFKLHVHVATEPLQIEVPLLGGSVKKTVGKRDDDPQGNFQDYIREYEADPVSHQAFDERISYSAALLYAGRYTDAVPVLVQLEKDHPGHYATASNLGTAYELTGDVPRALEWIKAGMERNAMSHYGTEWLHVAILETKLALQKDPDWLAKHSVLEGHDNLSRETKERALEYQLNERLYFIHENDPIMCDLMFQAALVTNDPAKKAYFLKQVPRFGNIRNAALKRTG